MILTSTYLVLLPPGGSRLAGGSTHLAQRVTINEGSSWATVPFYGLSRSLVECDFDYLTERLREREVA